MSLAPSLPGVSTHATAKPPFGRAATSGSLSPGAAVGLTAMILVFGIAVGAEALRQDAGRPGALRPHHDEAAVVEREGARIGLVEVARRREPIIQRREGEAVERVLDADRRLQETGAGAHIGAV